MLRCGSFYSNPDSKNNAKIFDMHRVTIKQHYLQVLFNPEIDFYLNFI